MPRIALKELETDRSLTVTELEGTIGRDPASAFVIEGPKSKVVSARHARIFFQDNAWWIEDSSRNGTILGDERLQRGQRYALKVGQVIGLGETGPRLRVAVLESRMVADTVMEVVEPQTRVPGPITAPRQPAATSIRAAEAAPSAMQEPETAALRRSEMIRAGLNIEEATEPASAGTDWDVHVILRVTHTNQRHDVRAAVVKVGRAMECHIRIPPELGPAVSRFHAEIAVQEGGVVVRDSSSRNGTYLNSARIHSPHHLTRGDQIMLGSGGPVLQVEDLHIVKADASRRTAEGSGPAGSATGGQVDSRTRLPDEPPTDPTPRDAESRWGFWRKD